MVRHHEYEDITLGADDCTPHGRATVARTDAKLLILCGISGGRVLAQDDSAQAAGENNQRPGEAGRKAPVPGKLDTSRKVNKSNILLLRVVKTFRTNSHRP